MWKKIRSKIEFNAGLNDPSRQQDSRFSEKSPPQNPVNPKIEKKALDTFKKITIEATKENAYDLDIFNMQITDEIGNEILHAIHEIGAVKWHLIHTISLQRLELERICSWCLFQLSYEFPWLFHFFPDFSMPKI